MKKILFTTMLFNLFAFNQVCLADNNVESQTANHDYSHDPYYYSEGDLDNEHAAKINYAYSNDWDLISEIKSINNYNNPWTPIDTNFGVVKKKDVEQLEFVESEGTVSSLSVLQYAKNVNDVSLEGRFTDPRPLMNSKKIKRLDITSNIDSIEFLTNLKELKYLSISFDGWCQHENSFYPLISDLSALNSLDNLEMIYLESNERPFPKISLKKSMNKYILVDPFILSKQFKNPEIKIKSKTPGFTFEDDILTWEGISPDTKELQISWKLESNETGHFIFEGNSVIPINWID